MTRKCPVRFGGGRREKDAAGSPRAEEHRDKPNLASRLPYEEAKAETFHWNPAGNQPRPAELASSRKRVLRGAGATRAAKRRQRVSGSCD
jgi:hypothetical protein